MMDVQHLDASPVLDIGILDCKSTTILTQDVTEHCSAVQIRRLLDAVSSIYEQPHDFPTVALVKRRGVSK